MEENNNSENRRSFMRRVAVFAGGLSFLFGPGKGAYPEEIVSELSEGSPVSAPFGCPQACAITCGGCAGTCRTSCGDSCGGVCTETCRYSCGK